MAFSIECLLWQRNQICHKNLSTLFLDKVKLFDQKLSIKFPRPRFRRRMSPLGVVQLTNQSAKNLPKGRTK